MENTPPEPVCIMGVNISCCKACPGKLKKALLKIDGIHSVVVNPKKCIVSVTDYIDPVKLVRKIRKMGKSTELLSYEKYPINLEEKKKNVHEKETEKEDCCCQFENGHYAKRTTFQDHEPVHFAKPQTEFLDHICGDVRTGGALETSNATTKLWPNQPWIFLQSGLSDSTFTLSNGVQVREAYSTKFKLGVHLDNSVELRQIIFTDLPNVSSIFNYLGLVFGPRMDMVGGSLSHFDIAIMFIHVFA